MEKQTPKQKEMKKLGKKMDTIIKKIRKILNPNQK